MCAALTAHKRRWMLVISIVRTHSIYLGISNILRDLISLWEMISLHSWNFNSSVFLFLHYDRIKVIAFLGAGLLLVATRTHLEVGKEEERLEYLKYARVHEKSQKFIIFCWRLKRYESDVSVVTRSQLGTWSSFYWHHLRGRNLRRMGRTREHLKKVFSECVDCNYCKVVRRAVPGPLESTANRSSRSSSSSYE